MTAKKTSTDLRWHKVVSVVYELEGTYLVIIPDNLGAFIVVDSRKPGRRLRSSLTLKTAKARAQHLSLNEKYKRESYV